MQVFDKESFAGNVQQAVVDELGDDDASAGK